MHRPLLDKSADQLDRLVSEYYEFRRRSKYDDASDVISNTKVREMKTRAMAAIERVGWRKSVYYEQAQSIIAETDHDYIHLYKLIGVLESLSADIKAGYLQSVAELIHGEIFGDFLEMAEYLAKAGYKDAAAVIAGSTLESHLRQLCLKSGIATETTTKSGVKPKKAELMNSELAGAGIYTKLDQKNVTAWLGLRNDAAHGNYGSYSNEQVSLMIPSIRDFLTRHLA